MCKSCSQLTVCFYMATFFCSPLAFREFSEIFLPLQWTLRTKGGNYYFLFLSIWIYLILYLMKYIQMIFTHCSFNRVKSRANSICQPRPKDSVWQRWKQDRGKWEPRLIYSFSSHMERPGVWIPVILVFSVSISRKQRSSTAKMASYASVASFGLPSVLRRITGDTSCLAMLVMAWSIFLYLWQL